MIGYYMPYDFEHVLRGAESGFCPTINILDQEYEYEDFEDFKAVMKAQVTERGGEFIRCEVTVTNQEMVIESILPSIGGKARHYQRLVRNGERSYCITATDSLEDWEKHKDEFISCVESFRLREK